jgi:hypothetical protein
MHHLNALLDLVKLTDDPADPALVVANIRRQLRGHLRQALSQFESHAAASPGRPEHVMEKYQELQATLGRLDQAPGAPSPTATPGDVNEAELADACRAWCENEGVAWTGVDSPIFRLWCGKVLPPASPWNEVLTPEMIDEWQGTLAGFLNRLGARASAEEITALLQLARAGRHLTRPAMERLLHDPQTWLIFYDDHDRPPEILTRRAAALRRYDDISASWNAHLFVRVHCNSRDAGKEGEPDNLVDACDRFNIPAPGRKPHEYGDFRPGAVGLASVPPAPQPEKIGVPYLFAGTRIKLSFSPRGSTKSLASFADRLDGRWVALVAAENDQHMHYHRAPEAFVEAARAMRRVVEDSKTFPDRLRMLDWLDEIIAAYSLPLAPRRRPGAKLSALEARPDSAEERT